MQERGEVAISSRTLSILGGIISAGFFAWSGVIWSSIQEVSQFWRGMEARYEVLNVKVDRIISDLAVYREELEAHKNTDAHVGTGRRLERIESKLERLER